ncbi:hypothetical protein CDAR_250421 [Caerostris darwini]|uniref:Serine/threonine-protein kinase 31 n=1 Tax=Caerostris darwini TaxID=1538125 RepID=A0AAV4UEC7_9ARAC|nr:hypothetical protein CDAR_250421 [Caerostris darwini]
MNNQTTDIYVSNVPRNTKEDELKQLFCQYGEIKDVLCRRKEDAFGYAIIKFLFKKDADRLLKTVGEVIWKNHILPIKLAKRSEHSVQNGNSGLENKLNNFSNGRNPYIPEPKYSNTDYGHFYPPPYQERFPYSQPMMLEVLCTNVENSITFYGCSVNRSDEFAMIMKTLNELKFPHNRPERKPSLRRIYGALFSQDKLWYRCTVIHSALPNKPGMCLVQYIDYGNKEEVIYRNIVEIPECLQKIPPLVTKFTFSNLICDNPSSKKSCLHKIINRRLTVCAYLSNSNTDYSVVKCFCDGKDIITETINKGFAQLQKSASRYDLPNHDFNSNVRAHVWENENKLSSTWNDNGYCRPLNIPKSHEAPVVNGSLSNDKKLQKPKNNDKNQSKIKEEQKNEQLVCNGTDEKVQKEDFFPKMIIKRGSELNGILKKNSSEKIPKEPNLNQPTTYTLDSVLPNLKLINNIRSLVSQSSDDSILTSAVDLLKNETNTVECSEMSNKCPDDTYKEYTEAVKKIQNSQDKDMLPLLKSERDSCRAILLKKLEEYLKSFDRTILKRKEKIQKVITDLESNSNAWMNVQLHKKPESVEELIVEYNKVKEERWTLVSKTRADSNQAHKQFMDILTSLQKEFYLNTLEDKASDSSINVCSIDKTTSFSNQLNKSIAELGKALDEEIRTLTVNKVDANFSIIQCLLDFLDIHKDKIDKMCDLYESHSAMYNELKQLPDIETVLKEVRNTCEEINVLIKELAFRQDNTGDSSQIATVRKQLHQVLLKEDSLKEILANVSCFHFPELLIEVPELNLNNLLKNKLLKSWKPYYFKNFGTGPRGESSYVSCLLDEPVTIKEYSFENNEDLNCFLLNAALWNEIKSNSLLKSKALFLKDEKTVCAILPALSNTLLGITPFKSTTDGEKSCRLLRQVLIGLKDIHQEGLVHNAVHPLTVVIEDEKALLDFCFDSHYLDGKYNLQGINFQPPDNKEKCRDETSDMYAFGCLVLWVLFPNLLLTTTTDGVPDITAFRSIIEGLILPKDYALLCALLAPNPAERPSAFTLLARSFLSKYEAYCRARTEAQIKAQKTSPK